MPEEKKQQTPEPEPKRSSSEYLNEMDRLTFRDKLFLLWLVREKYYGWLWLFFLMGLMVAFYFFTRNR